MLEVDEREEHPAPVGAARRRWPLAALAVLLLAAAAYQAHWVFTERDDLRVEIDESAYLNQAVVVDSRATGHDVGAIVDFYFREGHQEAPLLSAITVPFLVVGTISLPWALMTQVAVLLVLVVATYLLARRLADDRWALLAAAAVAFAPGILDFARVYHFALVATATLTLALWLLVASSGFRRVLPSLAWGAALGLCLLSRTMMASIVPAVVVAGLVAAVGEGDDRRRRLAWWGAAVGLMALVALPWWAANWEQVSTYLRGYGYGGEGSAYGPLYSPLEPLYYLRIPYRVGQELYLPLLLLVLGGLGVAAAGVVAGIRRSGAVAYARRTIRSGHLPVALVVLLATMALMTSRNKGTGFVLPLVPAVVVLAVAGYHRLRHHRPRLVVAVLFGLVVAVNLLGKSGDAPGFATPRAVALVSSEGALPITDGRTRLERYLEPSPYPPGADVEPVAQAVLDEAEARSGGGTTVLFGQQGDPLFNPAYLALVGSLRRQDVVVVSLPAGADEAGVEDALRGFDPGVATTDLVVTMDLPTGAGALPVRTDTAVTERAAEAAGYEVVREESLPDGRSVRLWAQGG